MAEASISVHQDQFICSVCLDLLKDPVTINCGHSFCMVCINEHWDYGEQRRVFSCPQCRETFTPRPVLRRNNMLAEVVEKVKKTELQAVSPAGPGDVECDFCTGRKLKAIKSCLVCVASLCETHVKPHLEIPALIKHKLVKTATQLQEICSQHEKLIEIYCHTDQSFICYLCIMEEHKGHDTVSAAKERSQKQCQLKKIMKESQQRIQGKKKKLQKMKQTVNSLKSSAQSAVEHSERIFPVLIYIEDKHCEVTELIRAQGKAELSRAEELLKKLNQEITDLKRRNTEMKQLSRTDDNIQFLQRFQSLSVCSRSEGSSSITVHKLLSFDGVKRSLSDLKKRLDEFCKEDFSNILHPAAAAVQMIFHSEPKTREDFLHYFCQLTLDPNTVHNELGLSENNRVVMWRVGDQRYSCHPERFDSWQQVLCKQNVSGRCYWEVEWSSGGYVEISVSYKTISRKGWGNECGFGLNNQSWSLQCSLSFGFSFWHNNIKTKISAPASSRIGLYVDHSAGILSFYSISDTVTLLHALHTTFTQPLCPGFTVIYEGTSVRLCDPE